jgi:hypothetical protein
VITFPASCPLTPCGGNVVGTWDYSGGCVDDPFPMVKQFCPTAQVTNATGTIKGSVTFTANQVQRTATATTSATIVLPIECTQGSPCSSFVNYLPKGSTCTGSGTCSCSVTVNEQVSDSDSYTVNGNDIVTGTGSTYNYCVSGNTMKYEEVGANVKQHGIFELVKR